MPEGLLGGRRGGGDGGGERGCCGWETCQRGRTPSREEEEEEGEGVLGVAIRKHAREGELLRGHALRQERGSRHQERGG